MALQRLSHDFARILPWVCAQSVMALGGICHLWTLASAATGNMPHWRPSFRAMPDSLQNHDKLLAEPWWIPGRAMADSRQSHDGLQAEPWWNPGIARTDYSQRQASYFKTLFLQLHLFLWVIYEFPIHQTYFFVPLSFDLEAYLWFRNGKQISVETKSLAGFEEFFTCKLCFR